MTLLQAAVGYGFIFYMILIIGLIIGTPLLVSLFMKVYWRIADKKQNIINKTPYYKDPLPFWASFVLAVLVLLGIFYLSLVLFDKFFPTFGHYT